MPKAKTTKKEDIKIGKTYGYVRVSTEKQELNNNKLVIEKKKEELNLLGDIEWIEEKISGTVDWRKRELGMLEERFEKGDVLIISELSRISRNAIEIPEFLSAVNKKGVKVYSLDVPIALDGSIQASMYISMVSIGAQMERENISQRTKNALNKRKADGKKLGRPIGKRNNSLKLDPYKEAIQKKILSGVTIKHLSSEYKCSTQTMGTYVKENKLKPEKVKNGDQNSNAS